jgi:hypothetical protein
VTAELADTATFTTTLFSSLDIPPSLPIKARFPPSQQKRHDLATRSMELLQKGSAFDLRIWNPPDKAIHAVRESSQDYFTR